MAFVALITGTKVSRTLATGIGAVMTGYAVTDESRVIDPGCRNPGCGVMTDIAFLGGGKMRGGFPGGEHAIMATGAGTHHLGMIHIRFRHRSPGDEIDMAGFANI